MTKRKIILVPDEILKKKSEKIEKLTKKEKQLADDLFETMYKSNGIGLAAVQVGVLRRMIVIDVSKKDEEKKPLCLICPLKQNCKAQKTGKQNSYPPRKQKTVSTKIDVSAAVIFRQNKVYIQKRKAGGLMGGLWEFPGGKFEPGESAEQCLTREIKEEMGVTLHIDEKLMTVKHSYTRFRVTLHVFLCRIYSGQVSPTQCEEWDWVKREELDTYPFPAANVKIIKSLMNHPV